MRRRVLEILLLLLILVLQLSWLSHRHEQRQAQIVASSGGAIAPGPPPPGVDPGGGARVREMVARNYVQGRAPLDLHGSSVVVVEILEPVGHDRVSVVLDGGLQAELELVDTVDEGLVVEGVSYRGVHYRRAGQDRFVRDPG